MPLFLDWHVRRFEKLLFSTGVKLFICEISALRNCLNQRGAQGKKLHVCVCERERRDVEWD
jgi:hypothetical protein